MIYSGISASLFNVVLRASLVITRGMESVPKECEGHSCQSWTTSHRNIVVSLDYGLFARKIKFFVKSWFFLEHRLAQEAVLLICAGWRHIRADI